MNLHTLKRNILKSIKQREKRKELMYGKTLSKKQIEKYKKERQLWTEKLKSKGLKITQNENTLYIGNLSPGCKLCKQGDWLCIYVTQACTRTCFFCPQKHNTVLSKNDCAVAENKGIKTKHELINIIKEFKAKGCGISGGEPLKVLERTLNYITWIKEHFGPSFYIWMYTNGDLITEKTLKKLKEAGLNEIRFNLAANGYDTRPVKLACKYLETVTVEIPAIPEDEEKVKNLLLKLDKLGVHHLNLHELFFTFENSKRLKRRGYKPLLGSSWFEFYSNESPVYGSELTAFHILDYALKEKISLPINFCSYYYKQNVQYLLSRLKEASIIKRPHEVITSDGFLKKIVIYESEKNLNQIIKQLNLRGVPRDQIVLFSRESRLETHIKNLKYLDKGKYEIGVVKSVPNYYPPSRSDVDVKIL